MNDDSIPALDQQLCFSLYSASLAMVQLYKPHLLKLGLTYPQYLVMLILWKQDGVSLNMIAKQLGQQAGALTPVLKRMEDDGLLTRNRSRRDERQLEIFLTSKGRSLKKAAKDIQGCIASACSMPEDKIQDLKERIDMLRTSIQESN